MIRPFIPAAALTLAIASLAQADQFAVQLDAAFDGANPKLMDALKISEIARVSENGTHYVILDAPSEAYVEAFILAIGHEAVTLNALEANWNNPVMDDLSMEQRLGFLQAITCESCTS